MNQEIRMVHVNEGVQMDIIALYTLGIVKAVVPLVYHTLELVRWCDENYDPIS